ncbi:MAG: flagellar hook assembly protein FlgD, partial [Rhodoferax sp.]|nr:flagellar hook assembly protein FlgD [Rhodoferax sp.]
MTINISSINNSHTSAAAIPGLNAAENTALSDSNSSQDRFLKLLVAQLNNQDPMNPMDNAQMTSQMAQINTVSGIQQVNETLKSMATQFTSMQVLQGSSMVGHDVLLNSNSLTRNEGIARGAIDLAGNTDAVNVE